MTFGSRVYRLRCISPHILYCQYTPDHETRGDHRGVVSKRSLYPDLVIRCPIIPAPTSPSWEIWNLSKPTSTSHSVTASLQAFFPKRIDAHNTLPADGSGTMTNMATGAVRHKSGVQRHGGISAEIKVNRKAEERKMARRRVKVRQGQTVDRRESNMQHTICFFHLFILKRSLAQ